MKTINRRKSRAVAPVLATLLMIAVAVAMSVIIFMWSQGFLSQTSESTGAQQGSQNQAAQSSVAIEMATFAKSNRTDTASIPKVTVIVRNVGAVSVTLGSITVAGLSANTNFTGSLIYTWSSTASTDVTETSGTWTIGTATDTSTEVQIAKGGSVTIVLTETGTTLDSGQDGTPDDTTIGSGDIITIKVTTSVGTFAQASFTVL